MLIVAWLLFAMAALGAVAHVGRSDHTLTISVASFAPYLMTLAMPAVVLFLLGRGWVGAGLSAIVLAALVATTVPLFVAATPPRGAVTLRVLTVNARLGRADPDALVRSACDSSADIVLVQELTPTLRSELTRSGLERLLAHHETQPAGGGYGTGLWSRFPVTPQASLGLTLNSVVVAAAVPGLDEAPVFAALHVAGPYPTAVGWRNDMQALPFRLRDLASGRGPVIVGGDYNATRSVRSFRRLVRDGYRDAGAQAGAGLLRTYPSNRPMIGIDHVLVRGATATEAVTVRVTGTDHQGVLVTVAVPRTS